MDEQRDFPTMIIPSSTEITVNEQGQLAIKTPGNLVIQNTGFYSFIECPRGSVRIDANVKVEAVSIDVADTCFVAGTLSTWRVKAKKVVLEKGAQAFIMLCESESLDLDRSARLSGNFNSPEELYLMLGRFNQQLRDLPRLVAPNAAAVGDLDASAGPSIGPGYPATQATRPTVQFSEPFPPMDVPPAASKQELETLALAQLVLHRELAATAPADPNHNVLSSLLGIALTDGIAGLKADYSELFDQLQDPSPSLRGIRERLERMSDAGSAPLP